MCKLNVLKMKRVYVIFCMLLALSATAKANLLMEEGASASVSSNEELFPYTGIEGAYVSYGNSGSSTDITSQLVGNGYHIYLFAEPEMKLPVGQIVYFELAFKGYYYSAGDITLQSDEWSLKDIQVSGNVVKLAVQAKSVSGHPAGSYINFYNAETTRQTQFGFVFEVVSK